MIFEKQPLQYHLNPPKLHQTVVGLKITGTSEDVNFWVGCI